MKRLALATGLLLTFVLLLSKNSMALTNEEAAKILKEAITKELKVLEVKEGPLQGFWEVVAEAGQEKMIVYVDKNLRLYHSRPDLGSPNEEESNSRKG